jgi:hypothetical protein
MEFTNDDMEEEKEELSDELMASLKQFVTPTFYKNNFFVQIGVHIKMHIKL